LGEIKISTSPITDKLNPTTELSMSVMKIIEKLEQLSVELYNKYDFESSKKICEIMQDLFEVIKSDENKSRLGTIIKKLELIQQYVESNMLLLERQEIDKKIEKQENKDK
jgi:hypothetical protein